jgi:hypothetical protein
VRDRPTPDSSVADASLSAFLRRRYVWIALAIQIGLSVFLAQGYDFRVDYVAGRNITHGLSPYLGGKVSDWMTLGYGSEVQGIGETPLWALYLGFAYFLSAGQPFIFNFISKIPIIVANASLAYLAFSKGTRGWRFYFLNVYVLTTSVTWGKPDNIATLLAIMALIETDSTIGAALLLSTSLMIKPLALAILPAFYSRSKAKSTIRSAKFTIETICVSGGIFVAPFLILRWPLETMTNGFASWFQHSGGFSLFNIVTIATGKEQLPPTLWWAGYLVVAGTLTLIAYALVRKPQNTLFYALLSSAVFFTLRPWNSEPNLLILLTVFILLKGDLPSRWLWIIPMFFAIANNALQEQLYLLMPTIEDDLVALYAPFNFYRLWLKFILSMGWLIVLWVNVTSFRDRQRLPIQSSERTENTHIFS